MIRIGFHTVPVKDDHERTIVRVGRGGEIVFEGSAHIGRGSRLNVNSGASLVLGDNFAISACSQINCYQRITFGRDIQFSWDCLVMDSDAHTILDEHDNALTNTKPIEFGDKVWIGCRSTILKGTYVPDNCVIGACSFVSGHKFEPNTIIAGHPAKSIKKIGGWKL